MLGFSQKDFKLLLLVKSDKTYSGMENYALNLKDKHKERFLMVGINVKWIDYGIESPLNTDIDRVKRNIKELIIAK